MKKEETDKTLIMVITSPGSLPVQVPGTYRVFLAGSIETGKAVNWQEQVIAACNGRPDIILLNPRRDDWDSSWMPVMSDPKFNEQVNWELQALDTADLIIMYFAPDTQSPITLLELGLHARSGKLVVCCPENFWRKGNVDLVCKRYDIPQVNSLEELMATLKNYHPQT